LNIPGGGLLVDPLKQSRAMSLVEAIANVVAGFGLALLTQVTIFPMFGVVVSLTDNIVIGTIFTGISILRSFVLRRLFEMLCGSMGGQS
jgi:hypothetical protein